MKCEQRAESVEVGAESPGNRDQNFNVRFYSQARTKLAQGPSREAPRQHFFPASHRDPGPLVQGNRTTYELR